MDCSARDKLLVQNNIIRGNWGIDTAAVSFSGSEITLVNNVVTSSFGDVALYASGSVHAINNTFVANYPANWSSLSIGAERRVYLYNNLLYNYLLSSDCYEYEECRDLGVWSNNGAVKLDLFNNDFAHATAILPGPIHPSNLDRVDPLFVDPEHGDYRLRPASKVINKGTNTAPKLPAKDIEGRARILLGKVDMGAYEATGASPAPAYPSPVSGATGVGLTPTLTWSAGVGATSHSVHFGTTAELHPKGETRS